MRVPGQPSRKSSRTLRVSMSRSLVGSSSSSTLGSVSSSRSSWNRRRSPPDRSPSRAVSLSPVKPNRSSSGARGDLAVHRPGHPPDRLDGVEHPPLGVVELEGLRQVLEYDGAPLPHPPVLRRQLAGDQREHRGLARPVDADDADPVARAEPPGGVLEQHPVATGEVHVLDVDHVLAEPLGGEALQLEPVARRRHVLDQQVGGVDPELRLGRAGRRTAPEPGELLAHQVLPSFLATPPPAAAAPPSRARTPHSRPRRHRRPRRAPPRSAGRPRRGTTGRG